MNSKKQILFGTLKDMWVYVYSLGTTFFILPYDEEC